jgi:hypothetical protein
MHWATFWAIVLLTHLVTLQVMMFCSLELSTDKADFLYFRNNFFVPSKKLLLKKFDYFSVKETERERCWLTA